MVLSKEITLIDSGMMTKEDSLRVSSRAIFEDPYFRPIYKYRQMGIPFDCFFKGSAFHTL